MGKAENAAQRGGTVPPKKDTGKKDTKKRTGGKATTASGPPIRGRKDDVILIDSPQVGSPTREGEVLEIIQGEVNVSYRVRWADGHESLITPMSGTARILPASERT